LGSFVASLGRACSVHAPPKIAIQWFYPYNTTLMTSIMLIVAPLGYVVGYFLTNYFVSNGSYRKTKKEVFNLLLF